MRDDSVDITHITLSVLFIASLIAGTFWILRPFLTVLLWAAIVVVSAWPAFLRLEAVLGGKRGLAVATATAMLLLVIFVPVVLALATIVRSADDIGAEVSSLESIAIPPPPGWLDGVPLAGGYLTARWSAVAAVAPEQRAALVTPYVQTALRWFAVKAGSVGATLLQLLLTTIVAAILFANGELVRNGILRFATRLAGQQGYDAAILAARAIRSVVTGVLVTAMVQTTIGALGLYIAGVPGITLLSAVMLFLCLAQVGPLFVLAPAVVWVYWSGRTLAAATLLVIALVAGTIDNFLRPLLIKRGVDLPFVLIFAGVIGGLLAFGVIGLFIGPVVLALAFTLLAAWIADSRARHARAVETVGT